jgi:hypothetical protein
MRKVFTKLLSIELKFLDLQGTLILKPAKAQVLHHVPNHWGYEPVTKQSITNKFVM